MHCSLKKASNNNSKMKRCVIQSISNEKIQPVREKEFPRRICVTGVEMVPKHNKKGGLDFEKQRWISGRISVQGYEIRSVNNDD